jgi:hypothetical protein
MNVVSLVRDHVAKNMFVGTRVILDVELKNKRKILYSAVNILLILVHKELRH